MDVGFQEWLRLWPYAVLMITVATWALYHFLAPAGWREWAGAGVVQGFIIALYAEMYGFPLTIYVLIAAFGLDIPLVHSSGHLWATLLGYGRGGALIEMAIGSLFVLAGLLLVIKGWVRIYFAGGQLQTDGVYGLVRHPQYTGVLLAVVGQLVHWPTLPTLLLAPVIMVLYVRLAHREERYLMEQFRDAYQAYQRAVPMLVPRWRDVMGPVGSPSRPMLEPCDGARPSFRGRPTGLR